MLSAGYKVHATTGKKGFRMQLLALGRVLVFTLLPGIALVSCDREETSESSTTDTYSTGPAAGSLAAKPQSDRFGFGGRRGRGWWNRVPPRFPDPDQISDGAFSFARVLYESIRDEPLGHGWNTDYPDSDINFMIRFSELTTTRIRRDAEGAPDHVVLKLTDKRIFEYPFLFMSDVGTLGFTDEEAYALGDYLKRGGFLYVDDFWGELAFDHWRGQLARALSPSRYPVVDVPPDHPVFRTFFTIREIPQIPSIQHWRWSSGAGTSERGTETDQPHLRGIFDENGRLMVIMTHNTDIADGWEREGEEREYFYRFSVKAYPVGVNIVLYAMMN